MSTNTSRKLFPQGGEMVGNLIDSIDIISLMEKVSNES